MVLTPDSEFFRFFRTATQQPAAPAAAPQPAAPAPAGEGGAAAGGASQ
jgi:hypothetical protein